MKIRFAINANLNVLDHSSFWGPIEVASPNVFETYNGHTYTRIKRSEAQEVEIWEYSGPSKGFRNQRDIPSEFKWESSKDDKLFFRVIRASGSYGSFRGPRAFSRYVEVKRNWEFDFQFFAWQFNEEILEYFNGNRWKIVGMMNRAAFKMRHGLDLTQDPDFKYEDIAPPGGRW